MAHLEKGKVITLAEAVAYADDSIVSRELVHNDAGSLTLFAFDAGQALSEHTAPFDAVVTIIDGQAEITIDGTLHHLKAGEMIIMPANHPHAVKATHRFKMVLTMIKG